MWVLQVFAICVVIPCTEDILSDTGDGEKLPSQKSVTQPHVGCPFLGAWEALLVEEAVPAAGK